MTADSERLKVAINVRTLQIGQQLQELASPSLALIFCLVKAINDQIERVGGRGPEIGHEQLSPSAWQGFYVCTGATLRSYMISIGTVGASDLPGHVSKRLMEAPDSGMGIILAEKVETDSTRAPAV
jgi:hypothetical protein